MIRKCIKLEEFTFVRFLNNETSIRECYKFINGFEIPEALKDEIISRIRKNGLEFFNYPDKFKVTFNKIKFGDYILKDKFGEMSVISNKIFENNYKEVHND